MWHNFLCGRKAYGGGEFIVMALGMFCIQNDWGHLSVEINCNISLTNSSCVTFSTFFQMIACKLYCLLGSLNLIHHLGLLWIIKRDRWSLPECSKYYHPSLLNFWTPQVWRQQRERSHSSTFSSFSLSWCRPWAHPSEVSTAAASWQVGLI